MSRCCRVLSSGLLYPSIGTLPPSIRLYLSISPLLPWSCSKFEPIILLYIKNKRKTKNPLPPVILMKKKTMCKSLAMLIFETFQGGLLSCCPLKSSRVLRNCKCQHVDLDPLRGFCRWFWTPRFLLSRFHWLFLITRYYRLFSYKKKSSILDHDFCQSLGSVLGDHFLIVASLGGPGCHMCPDLSSFS